ncbi:unnamed protein product, partial [Brassica rapa]
LCVLNIQPTWAKISRTVQKKGQRAESKDQCADMCTDGQPRTSYSPRGPKSPKQSTGNMLSPRTNVLLCVLIDNHRLPVCADGHTRTATDVLCVLTDIHGRPVTNMLICVLTDTHVRPVCADGHTRTHTDSHGRPPRTSCVCWRTPTDVLCVLNRQPTWSKITQTVHGKGQRAESKDQRADMCTDGEPHTSCGHTRTHTDSDKRHVCANEQPLTATDVLCVLNRQPTWAKITQTVHGKGQRAEASMLSPRTNVLICILMDSHRRPVCADGHTATHTDSHIRHVYKHHVCSDGQPQTATNILCVLADTHGRPVCTEQTAHHQRADMCTDGQPRTSSTDILCVLTDSHRHPVQPTWAKATRTVHGKGQRAESKDQRADIVLSPRTNMLICVLTDTHVRPVCADGHKQTNTDSHGRPVCADGHTWMSSTDVLCVLADTHGRPVCTEETAHNQRADMCTDGEPQTSSTDVLCVLADTHGRPIQPTWAKATRTVHGKGQRAESKDQRADIQPTWAKITRTVHKKGQRAESKDQHADMCTDGHPRTLSTDVLCVLADTHGRPVCTEQTDHVGQNHPNSPREGPAC